MKSTGLFLTALFLIFVPSCKPTSDSDGAESADAVSDNLKQIARGFRSEANIVVEQGTESYMGEFDHKVFVNDLMEAILEGKITAYNFHDDPLSIEDIEYMKSHVDTAEIENIETGEVETVLIEEVLNPDEVVKVFTTEDWFFNSDKFTMEKKVISMTLCTLKLDLEGEPIGYEILFKVYFDGRDQV